MKQLIIGIYDDGYDYTINFLDIENGLVNCKTYTKYDIETNTNIDDKLKEFGNILSYNYYDDKLNKFIKNNYSEYKIVITCDNGFIDIL